MSGGRARLPSKRLLQYAAVPYRRNEDGETEVMLLTSRETRRWVIPKGWPIRGAKPHASAAREALEEAGLIGRTTIEAIGTYRYDKRMKNGLDTRCKVEVFPLEVTAQRKRWREQGQRKLRWFTLRDAAKAVQEPGLRKLLRRLDRLVPNETDSEA
ncbi:NUDIX hydrolase [Rhodoplanes sp.]|uniref:NUDIX hydrolase n=1 Tax=Rhodoplanes sp. TaxID=1968906 RepID=UPI0025E10E2B|nr:NUDIX hydrolase [Rhodoplanes sp.]